jgi:hypothetical protein
MNKFVKALLVGAAAVGSFAGAANATLYQFTLTGAYNADWVLDSNPATAYGACAPAAECYVPGGLIGFAVRDVQGSFPTHTFDYLADIEFYLPFNLGGLGIIDAYDPGGQSYTLITDGATVFDNTNPADPMFILGVHTLAEFGNPSSTFQLEIEVFAPPPPPPPAVPEPASWAMMIAGFGLLGGAVRRRANRVTLQLSKA